MTRTAALLIFLSVSWAIGGLHAGTAQPPPIEADDSQVLELVFEQIYLRAGSAGLHVGRAKSQPVLVVDHARPICRQKVLENEMRWPMWCGADSVGRLKNLRVAQLPFWLHPAGLTDASRDELIRSFEERNREWQKLPAISATGAQMCPRERYFSGARGADDFVVFSLPGYTATGLAIVHASFSCGSLCGTEYIVVLRRSASSWKIISHVVGLGIS